VFHASVWGAKPTKDPPVATGLTRPQTNTNFRALSDKVKRGCSVQRIRTNIGINNLTASKRATFFKKQVHIFSQYGFKGRNVTLNLMTTTTPSPLQVVQSSATKVTAHTQAVDVCLSEMTP